MLLCSCGCLRPITFNKKKKIWNIFLKGHKFKHNFNRTRFQKIETENDAYWLGYFFADGFVRNKGDFGFHISKKDKLHLKKFLKFMRSTSILKNYNRQTCRVEIGDKDYCNTVLKKWGLVQGKSFKLSFPPIKKSLCHHFIRGYFDGDGWIIIDKRNKSLLFGVIGYINFIKKIQKILIEECNLNKTKLHYDKRHKSKSIVSLVYGGNLQCRRIFIYLYKRATICLERKKQIFIGI